MGKYLWSLITGCLVLGLSPLTGTVPPADAAQTPGPSGTYECWDRCQTDVGCNTVCYDSNAELITCNEYHPTCGGMGGVVGQGCGDGICWWDYRVGSETYNNCPADCHPPADSDHDGVPDSQDNCPGISNSNQADRDGDGKGDLCDAANGMTPPVACGWASLNSGTAPLGVWFYGTCSYDPDGGSITNYEWNLWNGITWGNVVYRTYYHPGTYSVFLTVWDDEGQSSTTYLGTIWVY